jgi:hypothetical protein
MLNITKDLTFFFFFFLTIFPGNSRGYVCVKLFCCVGKFLTATSPRDERTSRMDPMMFFFSAGNSWQNYPAGLAKKKKKFGRREKKVSLLTILYNIFVKFLSERDKFLSIALLKSVKFPVLKPSHGGKPMKTKMLIIRPHFDLSRKIQLKIPCRFILPSSKFYLASLS